MSIDYSDIGSNTPKKYTFTLSGATGTNTIKTAPLEWGEMKLRFKRDEFYMGVFSESVFDKLTFVEDGKDILKEIYDTYGAFGECDLSIKYFDYNTRTYKSLPTSYKLDFNTYNYIKVGAAVNAVEIAALPVSLTATLLQREKTNVDISKVTSIDGFDAALIDHWTALRKVLNFPPITIYGVAFYTAFFGAEMDVSGTNTTYNYSELGIESSDFSEAQSVEGINSSSRDKTYACFLESTQSRFVNVVGSLSIFISELSYLGDPSRNTRVQIFVDVIDSSSSLVSSNLVKTITPGDPDALPANQPITVDIDINDTVGSGESIIVYALGVPDNGKITLRQSSSSLRIREAFTSTSSASTEAHPVYEAIERNLQLILSKQRPFYSDFFGRTDVVKDSSGNYYSTENQLRFASVMNGLSIRGKLMQYESNVISVNFRSLFKSLKALWNVGASVEELDGEMKVRIEELAHYFEDSEILDLSDRLNDEDIEQENLMEWQYSNIKTGYKKAEYEAANGRGEYNTSQERTTELPSDQTYDNTSDYRADTQGIAILLENNIYSAGSEDVKGEDDIFIVKSQESGTEWDAETDENIQILNDSSLFEEGQRT